jgi:hypothetical protein
MWEISVISRKFGKFQSSIIIVIDIDTRPRGERKRKFW